MSIMKIPTPVEINIKDERVQSTQLLFCKYAKMSEKHGVTKVDISGVPVNSEFFVSSKEPLETFIGCNAYDYEVKNGFYNYRIVPLCKTMTFDNV